MCAAVGPSAVGTPRGTIGGGHSRARSENARRVRLRQGHPGAMAVPFSVCPLPAGLSLHRRTLGTRPYRRFLNPISSARRPLRNPMRHTTRWPKLCPMPAGLATIIASCSPDEPLAPPAADPPREPPPPAFAISDAVFNHGNPRFFWLPPVVAKSSFSGQPDGTLKPHVLVCAWRADVDRCGNVVADFGTTGGTGSQTVRYDATAGQYIVNWDTKTCLTGACTLSTTQPYRIRVFVGGSQLGFADVDLADNGGAIKNLDTSGG